MRGRHCFFPAKVVTGFLIAVTAAVIGVTTLLAAYPGLRFGPGTAAIPAPRLAAAQTVAGDAARAAAGDAAWSEDGDGPPGRHARAPAPGPATAPADRAWPVAGAAGIWPAVLRGWEPPPTPWAAGHRGVDLAAAARATVRAAVSGRVTFAGTVAGRGVLTIELSRSGRPPLRTTYEPVHATVRKGARVGAGRPVAVLQRGPFHCRGPCLHWGLRRGKTYLDPLTLLPAPMLRTGPSRLLPVIGVPVPRGPDPHGPDLMGAARPDLAPAREAATTPAGAALTGAVALAAAAVWALGRLSSERVRGGRHAGQVPRTGGGGGGWGGRSPPGVSRVRHGGPCPPPPQ